MKKTFRIICAVMCVALLAGSFCLQSFASTLRNNTNDKIRLYGDIDGDGTIEQSDFDYILGILSGEIEMPEIGTPEYYAADIMGDGITMEDARRCYRYLNGLDTAETYSPEERQVQLINDLIGVIKTPEFGDTMISYSYDYDYMETKNIDFGPIFTDFITGAMEEEDTETETYSAVSKKTVTSTSFPAFSRSVASTLRLSDIENMSIEVGVPCSLSADIGVPATVTAKNGKVYNMSDISAKEASYTDCIRVTVEIKTESYNRDIPADVKALAKKQLAEGYVMGENEVFYRDQYPTALYNLYGTDIIELGAQYPLKQTEESDGMGTSILAELGDITTAASAVFYFDRATLNPICCSYTVQTDITQHVEMSMLLGSLSVDGKMDPRNLMITQNNFWFYSYFTDAYATVNPKT